MQNTKKYWQAYYGLYSYLPEHKSKIEKSRQIIASFLSEHPESYVSWSTGKDSTALLHLALSVKPAIKVMSEKDDMDYPEEMEYLEMMREKYKLNLDVISPAEFIWNQISKFDVANDIHSRNTDFSAVYFYDLISDYKRKNNYSGVMLGLRAEESKRRLWNLKKRGSTYFCDRDGDWVCQPIASWTGADVFAYLISNNVPILDVYWKLKFVESPEQIRKSWILPGARASSGQVAWLKYYYPELYSKLVQIKPEIRCYS